MFLCHSTGGVAVKSMFRMDAIENRLNTFDALAHEALDVSFFATPHYGVSDRLDDPYIASMRPNLHPLFQELEGMRHQLVPRGHYLEDLNRSFGEIAISLRIHNFWTEKVEYLHPYDTVLMSTNVIDNCQIRGNHWECPKFKESADSRTDLIDDLLDFQEMNVNKLQILKHLREQILEDVAVDIQYVYPAGGKRRLRSLRAQGRTETLGDFLSHGLHGTSAAVALDIDIGLLTKTETVSCDPTYSSTNMFDGTAEYALGKSVEILADLNTENSIIKDKVSLSDRSTLSTTDSKSLPQLSHRDEDRLTWINIPANHPDWIKHVLQRIAHDVSDPSICAHLPPNEFWQSIKPDVEASSRPITPNPVVKIEWPSSIRKRSADHTSTSPTSEREPQLMLSFPYLHWETFERMKKLQDLDNNRLEKVPPNTDLYQTLQRSDIQEKILSYDPRLSHSLHIRRTLEQFGHPRSKNTAARDERQTLYMRDKTRHFRVEGKEPVLMVDQLWVLVLNSQHIVSFISPNTSATNYHSSVVPGDCDIRLGVLDNIEADNVAAEGTDSYDLAATIFKQACQACLSSAKSANLQVMWTYDQMIDETMEKLGTIYLAYRDSGSSRVFPDVETIDVASIGARNVQDVRELHQIESVILELKDIEHELRILTKLFREQDQCLYRMEGIYHELNDFQKGIVGTSLLQQTVQRLSDYQARVSYMARTAAKARLSLEELIRMRQQQVNITEAILARQEARYTAEQSRAILVFTVFTIVFLPLSFFATVFGMNAREWSGDATNPSLHSILTFMLVISFVVTILALSLAFSRAPRELWKTYWRRFRSFLSTKEGEDSERALRQHHVLGAFFNRYRPPSIQSSMRRRRLPIRGFHAARWAILRLIHKNLNPEPRLRR